MASIPKDFQRNLPVMDWASEPQEDRPSEFAAFGHSTGYSSLSSLYSASTLDSTRLAPRGRAYKRSGNLVPIACAIVLCIGAAAMYALEHFLRG
jgi:hypothetical protein